MAVDLDRLTHPTGTQVEREVYDPVNAWPGAPARIIIQVNKMSRQPGDAYQVGFDYATGSHWLRSYKSGRWGIWNQVIPLPQDEEANP